MIIVQQCPKIHAPQMRMQRSKNSIVPSPGRSNFQKLDLGSPVGLPESWGSSPNKYKMVEKKYCIQE